MRPNVGIRTWLVLLVLIAVTPGMLLAVYGHFASKRADLENARAELRSVARLASASQAQTIEGVRQILSTVVAGPSVRRDDLLGLCMEYLRNIGRASPGYGNIGVVDLKGDMRCQGHPDNVKFNVADRQYFRGALANQRFSVGEYLIGKVTGRPQLGFGMPVYDDGGDLRGVAFATIDLRRANQRLQALGLPRHLQVLVVDATGTVLLSSTSAEQGIGSPLVNASLAAAIRTARVDGVDTTDDHGAAWLHEIATVADVGGAGLYVVASARRAEILGPVGQRLTRELAILAASTILGLLLAWLLSVRQIADPVWRLLQRMQDAALDKPMARRTGSSAIQELDNLEEGFEDMLRRLHSHQEQLAKAQQIAQLGFYQLDLRTRVYTATATVYAMLGLDPAQGPVTVEQYQGMLHPDDRDLVNAHRDRLFSGGKPLRLQYRIVRPDGQIRWLDGFGFVDRDADGSPTIYAGALQDITDQQRLRSLFAVQGKINAAIVLTTSSQDLYERACQIAVEDGGMRMAWVATVDAATNVVVPSVHAGAESGYLTLVRRTAIDIQNHGAPVPTALRTGALAVCNDIATGVKMGSWKDAAFRRGYRSSAAVPICVDGKAVAVLAFMASAPNHFQDEERELLRAIGESLSLAVSNFDREARRRAAEAQLHLLAACISNLNDVVMITEPEPTEDGSHRIVFVNEAFTRLTGYSRDEVVGRSPRLLQGPLSDRDELTRVAAALRRWQPVCAEVINYRKDGSRFWVEMDIVPVKDARGRVTNWVSVERDTTVRREAAEKQAMLEAQVREAQKSEAIGTLAAGIAHDFNNILAAVLGNLALARQDLAQGRPAQERLAQIERSAGRARTLVEQILSYSRRQDGALQQVPQDLKLLLAETMSLLRATVPARVQLQCCVCEQPVVVIGDGVALEQVLMNLGTNAWQALQGSSGEVCFGIDTVEIGDTNAPAARQCADGVAAQQSLPAPRVLPALPALPAGPYAWLWVADDGCGMDAATQARIFEPFFTTKPVGSGTGLGLSVVQGIVRAHGGAIALVSTPGQGTVFHVVLPLSTVTPPAALAAPSVVPQAGQGQHVLYVDDDEVMVAVAAGLLEHWGYCVTSMRNAGEAVAAVRAHPQGYDLVITDFNMPGLSGLDVLRALRMLRTDLPVVLTSGYIAEDIRSEALAAGAFAVLRKENLQDELAAIAMQALQPG